MKWLLKQLLRSPLKLAARYLVDRYSDDMLGRFCPVTGGVLGRFQPGAVVTKRDAPRPDFFRYSWLLLRPTVQGKPLSVYGGVVKRSIYQEMEEEQIVRVNL